MKRPVRLLVPLACLFFLSPIIPPAAQATPTPANASPPTDPKALKMLKRMCDTLAAAKAFTYKFNSAIEARARTGQFVTLYSSGQVELQRPDKLRATFTGEAPHFDFYYNGKTVTAYAPGTNVYSVTEAPPTIDAMLPFLRQETGIRFITSGLLFRDPYSILTRKLTSAFIVGPDVVNGTPCMHLALRSEGVNWEIC